MTPHREFVSTGYRQEATPDRQRQGADRLNTLADYHRKAHSHLWTVLVVHIASDAMLDATDGPTDALPMLDVDTMAGPPGLVCFVCEAVYEPRLRRRKCPGDPTP